MSVPQCCQSELDETHLHSIVLLPAKGQRHGLQFFHTSCNQSTLTLDPTPSTLNPALAHDALMLVTRSSLGGPDPCLSHPNPQYPALHPKS